MNQYSFTIHLKHKFGKALTRPVLYRASGSRAECLSANAPRPMEAGSVPCQPFFSL